MLERAPKKKGGGEGGAATVHMARDVALLMLDVHNLWHYPAELLRTRALLLEHGLATSAALAGCLFLPAELVVYAVCFSPSPSRTPLHAPAHLIHSRTCTRVCTFPTFVPRCFQTGMGYEIFSIKHPHI